MQAVQFLAKPNTKRNVVEDGEDPHFVENGKVHRMLEANVVIEKTSSEVFECIDARYASIAYGIARAVFFLVVGLFLDPIWVLLAALEFSFILAYYFENVQFMKIHLRLQVIESSVLFGVLVAIVLAGPQQIVKWLISHKLANLATFFDLRGVVLFVCCFLFGSILRIFVSFNYIKHVSFTKLHNKLTTGNFSLVLQF